VNKIDCRDQGSTEHPVGLQAVAIVRTVFPGTSVCNISWLYSVCVITDVLDGFIARRYDACTDYGHLLDSLGDAFLAVAVLATLVPFLNWGLREIILITAVVVVRLTAFVIGSIRFGRLAFLHSYLNKAAGLAFFISPFLIKLIGLQTTVAIVGIVCILASLEYLYVNTQKKEYDPNYRSVFLDKW